MGRRLDTTLTQKKMLLYVLSGYDLAGFRFLDPGTGFQNRLRHNLTFSIFHQLLLESKRSVGYASLDGRSDSTTDDRIAAVCSDASRYLITNHLKSSSSRLPNDFFRLIRYYHFFGGFSANFALVLNKWTCCQLCYMNYQLENSFQSLKICQC